jgi:hypothetical protein
VIGLGLIAAYAGSRRMRTRLSAEFRARIALVMFRRWR